MAHFEVRGWPVKKRCQNLKLQGNQELEDESSWIWLTSEQMVVPLRS